MVILVAGGAGFIGSHLCERLVDDGHSVVCLDNFVTGRWSNIEHLSTSGRFTVIAQDLIKGAPDVVVDRIYHLASPASPVGYQRHPLETMRVNSEGTHSLLDLARRTGARFLFASTSEVYGDPMQHPQRETYFGNVSSTGPRSMYDEAKRYGEAITMVFQRTWGVDTRIVRIFNTYGPRSDPSDGRLVPNFVAQALTGRPITLYGSGQQTRSLCFVSDLVEGLLLVMESDLTRGEVVNLGNPDEHTISQYAEIIRDLAGSNSELVFTEYAVGDDPRRRRPDISKARDLLGWEPRVGLIDGLRPTIDYFRREMALERAPA